MLDNWTVNQFFFEVSQSNLENFSIYNGRIAIIDDPELEKLYDQYTLARQEIMNKYYNWENEVRG